MNEKTISPLIERLQRFGRALGFALLDRRLELEGRKLINYYDTNVIYHMILGFESEYSQPKADSRQKLVRSLLACGRFGEVRLLRPHLLELDNRIWNQPRPKRHKDDLHQKAQEFLRVKDIDEVLIRLHQIVTNEGTDGVSPEKMEQLLEILRDHGAETFTAIEQICGTWTSRFRRFRDAGLIHFDRSGPDIQDMMNSHHTLVFKILKILDGYRPSRRVNAFNDSIALSILRLKLLERDRNPRAEIVRFYSHDGGLNEAFQNDRLLQEMLAHQVSLLPKNKNLEKYRSAIRDDDYFLMRLRFEELVPRASGTDLEVLEKIEALHNEIEEIIEQDGNTEVREEAVAHIHWKDKPLLEVLDEFEKLSLLESIWAGLPHYLFEEGLEKWEDIYNFVVSGQFSNRLDERISDIQQELSEKVSQMKRWTQDFKVLQDGSWSMRKRINKELEDPMRDLGLVRWGYSLVGEAREDLVDSVKSLLQAGEDSIDQDELDEICSQLAGRMEVARQDIKECLFMSAILWAIGKLKELVSLIDACEDSINKEMPPTLRVLRAAAKMKSPGSTPLKTKTEHFEEKRALVDSLWALAERIPEEQRGGYLLGVGYVLYHAWKSESRALEIGEQRKDIVEEVRKWACRSLEAGRNAMNILSSSDLAWAFAVNHCAYVGLVTETGSPEETEDYRKALVKLQGEPPWHSRFEDTLGCFHLIPMEREWKDTPAKERFKLEFDTSINRAEKHFEAALEIDFGDIDLQNHIKRLEDLKYEYEQIKQKNG